MHLMRHRETEVSGILSPHVVRCCKINLTKMLLYWLDVIAVFNLFLCVFTCDTFHNVEMNAITREKKKIKVKVNGCIERVAFNGETMIDLDVNRQDVPVLKKDSVRNMVRLGKLTIRNCNLAKIEPAAFRNTPRLTQIEFVHTKISELAKGIFNNTLAIEEISLHNNRIDFIEDNVFSDMNQLKFLNLSYNKLEQISRNWYYEIPSLLSIDFQHNLIRSVPRKAFIHVRTVQSLSLDYNNIMNIQSRAFEGMVKVKYLGLKHNLLKTLHENVFPDQISIESLFVDANRLNFLSEKVLQKVHVLGIDGNPLKCPCIENISRLMFARQGKLVHSKECLNLNIPVCVEPAKATTVCEETEDEEVRSVFYSQVQQYMGENKNKCVQLS